MAQYTIYCPQHSNAVPQQSPTYITELLTGELKTELTNLGHNVNIVYINLYHDDTLLYIEQLDINITLDGHISDSLWFMLANDETKKFVIMDLQDSPSISNILNNLENCVMTFLGQCSLERCYVNNSDLDVTKILPFAYFPYYPKRVESYIQEVRDIRNSSQLDDRVFFLGNNRPSYRHDGQMIREVISILEYKYPDEVRVGSWEKKLPADEFWKAAATHTISLGLPGHPWCSREHELWTLGLPVMLYEHTHHMMVDLIPNYHYVAVPVGKRLTIGMAKSPEVAADQIMKIHREWIKPGNRWRLNNIARHGQQRMLKEISVSAIIPKLITFMQLGNW